MSLFTDLQNASSEEDVKDIYIRHLKLKSYQKNLIDIQTKEIWFEAKIGSRNSTYAMFTQLLRYVWVAQENGEEIPPFLCVIDSVKAALMKTETVLPFIKDKSIKIKWGSSASDVTQDALDKVSQFIGTHFVSFNIQNNEEEFKLAVKSAIEKGEIVRTQITPDNLKQVFDKWVQMIGKEIKNVREDDWALLFFADVMSDGTVNTHENLPAELLHKGTKPAFLLNGNIYELGSVEGYRKFWALYDRPPKEEYRNYLLERRDSLIPTDERSFKGAYYTPLHVVDRAYELLEKTLGKGWQKNYIVWDMCCGVGNLETKHSNHRNIYMSTLDKADVDVMKAARTCVASQRFQYDYLNDDITEQGTIDYSLTNKIPQGLRDAIAEAKEGKKKILVLINPPYGEATNKDNTAKGSKRENKSGIAKTRWAEHGMAEWGKASNELFLQFVTRIAREIPNARLAMFSTLKYINSQTSEKFRSLWKAKYLGGFAVHSKAFDGIRGDFPIGFLLWETHNDSERNIPFEKEVTCTLYEKDGAPCGEKTFFNLPASEYLSNWITRPKTNRTPCVPLTNAITSPVGERRDQRGTRWSDGAVGFMCTGTNDFQNQSYIFLLSSGASRGHGIFVNEENLWQCAVLFTVEKIIAPTWKNDRDQFLAPNKELPEEFRNDCLVWMLFNGSNLSAGVDGIEWGGKSWSVVNHFIPFTEEDVGSPERFESDFMVRYMQEKTFSAQAGAVLAEGKKLWQVYFSSDLDHTIRSAYKLNRSDSGWYQVRMTLKALNEAGDRVPISFAPFEAAYSALTEKLKPLVYEYGFLR